MYKMKIKLRGAIVLVCLLGFWGFVAIAFRSILSPQKQEIVGRNDVGGDKSAHQIAKAIDVSLAETHEEAKEEVLDLSTEQALFRAYLRSCVNQGKLKLSSSEVGKLVSLYMEAFEAIARVEARSVQLDSMAGATMTLKIPPFPKEGDIIKELFLERLSREFPIEKVGEIGRSLGTHFDMRLKAFGNSEQTIVIERVVGYEPFGQFMVTWKVAASRVAQNESDVGSQWADYSSTYQGTVGSIDKSSGIGLAMFIKATWPLAGHRCLGSSIKCLPQVLLSLFMH